MRPNLRTPCLDALRRELARLEAQAANAARRNKPTMWAYYARMRDELRREFGPTVARTCRARGINRRFHDSGIAGVALAICQRADAQCPLLPRDAAADLWALSVYASRILRSWGAGPAPRRSLAWLRERAKVRRG